jgi:alpha-tubulin suppressor-like RCC1 family protein
MRMPRIAAAVAVVTVPVTLSLAAAGLVTAPPTAAQPAAAQPATTQPATATHSAATAQPAVTSARAWGDNSAGELGNGTLSASTTPVAVGGLSGATAISAGGRHALALLSGGTVMAWGDNTFGQLGNGTTSSNHDAENPVAVTGLTGVTQVSAGGEHSLALLSNGTVMAWGDNGDGQLGNGTTASSDVPVAVTGLTGVTAVSAGNLFSVALLSNGTVMTWGYNGNGELGDGTYNNSDVPVAVTGLTGVSAIAAGGQHVLALMSNGTASSWGENEDGQLGDGSETSGSSDVPVQVEGLTGAVALSAGYQHSLALLSNGNVMAWGDNGFNQLGQPSDISNSDVPLLVNGLGNTASISAGGLFSLALLTSGTVMAWGDGAFGQIGNGSTTGSVTPTAVSGITSARAISAGGVNSTALVASAPPAAPAPVSSIWRVSPTPVPNPAVVSDLSFAGVSAASATDAWAVGTDEVTQQLPLAEHWNGTTWSKTTVPLPAGTAQAVFTGTDDLGTANAWAVGYTEAANGTGQQTLIEHWTGSAWAVVPSPDPETGTGATDVLTAISGTGPDDLWAVGYFSDDTDFTALLFEHWNGTAWSFVAPPTESATQFGEAVTAITPDDVWVVGDTGSQATVSAHWNGTSWLLVSTPTLTSTDSIDFLNGLSAAGADDVWASGYEGNVDDELFDLPYMLHWNGTSWTLVKVPNTGTEGSFLRGTTVLSATDVWSVGTTEQTDGGSLTLTEHYNGTTWSAAPSLDPGQLAATPANGLNAAASPGDGVVWAVGTQEIPGQCCLRTLAEATSSG